MKYQPYMTVFTPAYNRAHTLTRLYESLKNQTADGFEWIVINDGSTDGSGKICDGYAEYYYRISVILKENGVVSSARNAWLDAADGEYITFIDSDDAIPPGYLKTLY